MQICLGRSDEAPDAELALRLLALLNQVSAAVDDLGFDESSLVHLARSLHHFDESADKLIAKSARVAVDELFLVHTEHLGHV